MNTIREVLTYLHAPICRSEVTYQMFSYRGNIIWNYISLKVNTDVSYACFKKLVKHYLQSNPTPIIRLNNCLAKNLLILNF